MRHVIIGTAGHIDHGKTALIRALTGQDTDRLEEEKRRGITIDLGFAWFDLPEGGRAGIVDVPGHERFIRNMAAGASGMDLVLLVIAADEGVMPQTREHMDILRLFGVTRFIVVLTKCDLAEEEWIRMVEEEIREETRGTCLEQAPMVRVSSVTGAGLDQLREEIVRMCRDTSDPEEKSEIRSNGYPRLPVDRVFTVKGAGTVVTGTMLDGSMREGDEVQVYPAGPVCRIREIQVYNARSSVCGRGQRGALNLTGIQKEEIHRGSVIAPAGSIRSGRRIDVRLELLPHTRRTVKNQSRLHFYCGTAHLLCRVMLLDRDVLEPGESGYAQLRMESDTALRAGDRFVVRFYSPEETIGGGLVLDACAPPEKRYRPEVTGRLAQLETRDPVTGMEILLRSCTGEMARLDQLAQELLLEESAAAGMIRELEAAGKALVFPGESCVYIWHPEAEDRRRGVLLGAMEEYFRRWPYRRGVPIQQIRSTVLSGMKKQTADMYLDWLTEKQILEYRGLSGELLAPRGYEPEEDVAYCRLRTWIRRELETSGCLFWKPEREEDISDAEEILRLMRNKGELVQTAGGEYMLPEVAGEILNRIRERYSSGDLLTVIQIREMFSTSRKNAMGILALGEEAGLLRQTGSISERQMI